MVDRIRSYLGIPARRDRIPLTGLEEDQKEQLEPLRKAKVVLFT